MVKKPLWFFADLSVMVKYKTAQQMPPEYQVLDLPTLLTALLLLIFILASLFSLHSSLSQSAAKETTCQ